MEHPCLMSGQLRDLLQASRAEMSPQNQLIVCEAMGGYKLLVMDRPLDRAHLRGKSVAVKMRLNVGAGPAI